MKSTFRRLTSVASLFSLAVLLGLPVPQFMVAAHASSLPSVSWSATSPIVYFPIRGDVINTGLANHPANENGDNGSGQNAGQNGANSFASGVPSAPTITSVTAGSGSVTVAWSKPLSSGGSTIRRYVVRYSSTSGTSWVIATSSASGSPYTVTGLSSTLSYIFEVAATNRSGTGLFSAPSNSVTPGAASVPSAPPAPSATPGVGSATVSWQPPSSNGGSSISRYSVAYLVSGSSSWVIVTTNATGSSYTVSGLSSATSYTFEVAATNQTGTGPFSSSSNAVTPLATSNGIIYHGGPVLVNSVNVYEIWYGNWTTSSTPARQSLVDTFLHGIGKTPYFNTNTSYYNAAGVKVVNNVTVVKSVTITSGSTSLNQNSFASIVANTIGAGNLPADPNGVYYVFTSQNVSVSGFLTQFCGFHSAMTVNSTPLQYAFVGDPNGNSLANCAGQTSSSPNGDPAGDAMVSVIAHELSEATTDPQLNAWYDASGNENGDLCAWNFGTTFRVSNGSAANVTWTINSQAYNFLVQQNWVNASGGYCALSY